MINYFEIINNQCCNCKNLLSASQKICQLKGEIDSKMVWCGFQNEIIKERFIDNEK